MLKVNLETELIKENKKIHSPKELLLIKEYDRLGENIISDLEKVFPNMPAKSGKAVKRAFLSKIKETEKFNKERIFHISQIKGICNKYLLRFLPTIYYKGAIDASLTKKITEFELLHQVKLSSIETSFIIAPGSSFELEAKPKDPLLFYKINSDYYYLIHKWGNDLSMLRRLKSFFVRVFSNRLVLPIVFFIGTSLFLFENKNIPDSIMESVGMSLIGYLLGGIFCLLTALLNSLIHMDAEDNEGGPYFRLIEKKEYDSPFI